MDHKITQYNKKHFHLQVVVVLGCTGSGISATANALINQKIFSEASVMRSETCEVKGRVCKNWFSREGNDGVLIIDTPGYAST